MSKFNRRSVKLDVSMFHRIDIFRAWFPEPYLIPNFIMVFSSIGISRTFMLKLNVELSCYYYFRVNIEVEGGVMFVVGVDLLCTVVLICNIC